MHSEAVVGESFLAAQTKRSTVYAQGGWVQAAAAAAIASTSALPDLDVMNHLTVTLLETAPFDLEFMAF